SGFAASAALVRKQNAIAAVFNALILNSGVAKCFVVRCLWRCARKENADQAWLDDGDIAWWLVAAE
ncbi:MAG: hypothetical protein WCF39_03200, partial [Pseudolabrys sp.]